MTAQTVSFFWMHTLHDEIMTHDHLLPRYGRCANISESHGWSGRHVHPCRWWKMVMPGSKCVSDASCFAHNGVLTADYVIDSLKHIWMISSASRFYLEHSNHDQLGRTWLQTLKRFGTLLSSFLVAVIFYIIQTRFFIYNRYAPINFVVWRSSFMSSRSRFKNRFFFISQIIKFGNEMNLGLFLCHFYLCKCIITLLTATCEIHTTYQSVCAKCHVNIFWSCNYVKYNFKLNFKWA